MPAPPTPSARNPGLIRKLLLSLVATLLALAITEGFASLWLAADGADLVTLREESHARYDPDLGWSHQPGTYLPDHYGPGRSLTVNSQGLRALEEYDRRVPAGRYRVLCVGDSFTMGFGVDDRDTYAAQLERLCPAVQAVNMGMGGYGLGQAYLWYERDGAALDADLLVFAFIDADLYRTDMDEFLGVPKPRLEVRDGELVTTNVPVPRRGVGLVRRLRVFLADTALARLLRGEGEAEPAVFPDGAPTDDIMIDLYNLAEHILDAVVALAREREQQVLLLYLPTRKLAYLDQRSAISRWFRSYVRERDVPFLDLGDAFDDVPREEVFSGIYRRDGHFDVRGNAVVAERLHEALRARVPGFPGCDAPP